MAKKSSSQASKTTPTTIGARKCPSKPDATGEDGTLYYVTWRTDKVPLLMRELSAQHGNAGWHAMESMDRHGAWIHGYEAWHMGVHLVILHVDIGRDVDIGG